MTNKKRYLFPGWHDSAAVGNALYYTLYFCNIVERIIIYGKTFNSEKLALPRIQHQHGKKKILDG